MTGNANPANSAASGDWIVVGKARKEKRAAEANNPTPASPKKPEPKQVTKVSTKKLPNLTNGEKNNNKTDKEGSKNKDNSKKVTNKKQNEKSKSETEKFKQPKNLEQAFSAISATELQESCNSMTLSDVARYLNSKLSVHQNDEIYTKDIDFPQSIVPSKIKAILINAIKSKAHLTSLHYCIEFCLSSIGYNMVKELPVAGYELMIQLIASVDPLQFIKCTDKLNIIMNSFQNRPSIGLTLLWAVGQGGFVNFKVGCEVWKKSMLPMIEMKHYFKYVVNYMTKLLEIHSQEINSKNISITADEYIELVTFFSIKSNIFTKDIEKLLIKQIFALRILCMEKSESWKNFKLDRFLDEIPNTYSKTVEVYDIKTKEMITCAVEILKKNKSAFDTWKTLCSKYLKQSSHILKYLDNNWNTVSNNINIKSLSRVTSSIKSAYQKSSKNKADAENSNSIEFCQNIEKKAASSSKGGFPWLFGSFVLLILIFGASIAYDIQTAGSYEKSYTSQGVKHALEYGNYGLSRSLSASARGYLWVEKNAPHYYTAVADFSKPYFELACDMWLVVSNQAKEMCSNMKDYAVEKWPVVYSTIDHYVPGLLSAMCEYTSTAWSATKTFSAHYYEVVATYLSTKVFVDNWAPDVLRAKTAEAFNTTQLYAVEYYKRFYKQVDHYSKL